MNRVSNSQVFSLTTLALMVLALGHLGPAQAQVIGACLSPGGDLSDVSVGVQPSCSGNKAAISWGVVGPEGPKGETGDAGATGQQGAPGPAGSSVAEVILGAGETPRDGAAVGDHAASDCLTTYGAGARWANSRDLSTLAWDESAPPTGGWVNWYPLQRDGAAEITDVSGLSGPASRLACACTVELASGGALQIPWCANSDSQQGMDTTPQSGVVDLNTCDSEQPAICVGPQPGT